MFSSQGGDEDQSYQDVMIWQQDDDNTQVEGAGGGWSRRKPPQLPLVDGDESSKKMVHREIERQRRQEMAALYASLRTLLPLEHIKGKRSVSDHMDGAVRYIKQTQNRISELRGTRDELKKVSTRFTQENATSTTIDDDQMGSSSSITASPSTVTVRPCSGGIEILCSSGLRDGGFMSLSRMLQVISDHGLAATSCVSTQVDTRFLHTINTEVCDLTCMDLSGLQQKLVMALAP